MNNGINQFRDAMQSAGSIPPDMVESDGKLHRFASRDEKSVGGRNA
jgi:hypothetical protein